MKTNLKDLRNSINGRCMSLINDGWYNCGDLLEHDLTNFINEKLFLYDIKDEFKIDYYFSLDDLEKLLIWAKNDIGIDYKIILDINNLLWNNNNVSNNNKKYINDFNIDIITTICNKFASTVIHMFYDYDYDTLSNDKLPVDWLHDLYMCLDKNELSKMIFDYPDFANKKYKKLNIFFDLNYKSNKLNKIRKRVDIIDNSKLLNIDINELNFQDSQKIDDFINMYESSLKEFFEIKIKELLKDKKYNRCVNKFSTEELNNNIKKISEVILGDNTKNNIYFLNYDKKKDIYYLCCYEITIHYNCYQDKINNINKHVYVLNEYKKYEVPTKNILIEIGKEKCNWYRDSSLLGCSFTLYSGYFNNI